MGDLQLTLHCHHQNDLCIKIGSDESHLNVSFIAKGTVARQCPQTIYFFSKRRAAVGNQTYVVHLSTKHC